MAKEKKEKKLSPQKSKRFVFKPTATDGNLFHGSFEVTRKPNKKDPDIDTESLVFAATFSVPDIYECSLLTIDAAAQLTKDEYVEILQMLENMICLGADNKLSFIQVLADNLKANEEFSQALLTQKYFTDEADSNYLVKEIELPNYVATFMCLGMGVGVSFGLNIFHNTGTGMCLGMAIGVAIGSMLNSSQGKKRDILRKARVEGLPMDNKEDKE